MDSKKIIIFYYSYSTMSTEKLVKGIQASFPNIEILLLPNEEKNDVTSYDYIGFASGIYAWDFGKPIYQKIENVDEENKENNLKKNENENNKEKDALEDNFNDVPAIGNSGLFFNCNKELNEDDYLSLLKSIIELIFTSKNGKFQKSLALNIFLPLI